MSTGIEWTDETWNPTTGCDRVSAGCDNCYALGMAKRLKAMGQPDYQTDGDPKTSGPGFGLAIHPQRLDQPLRWKKPRKVFVNSMSDLFHDSVPVEHLAQVFAVMSKAPQHTFQILTKRHARMRSTLSAHWFRALVDDYRGAAAGDFTWPLPNVWLGVSVENQQWADIRIPALLQTPAAVRWLSCEPLLGPIDLHGPVDRFGGRPHLTYWLTGQPHWVDDEGSEPRTSSLAIGPKVDWVVVGGESGPGARPMHPDWARTLRDQCAETGVPYLFKQWGAWIPESLGAQVITEASAKSAQYADINGGSRPANVGTRAGAATCHRVGKHAAGRELDGRTWDQYPATPVPA